MRRKRVTKLLYAFLNGQEDGVGLEKERIVEWLRAQADMYDDPERSTIRTLAELIDSDEHWGTVK